MSIKKLLEQDFKEVETLIYKTISEINSKDYSSGIIKFMLIVDPFSPRNKQSIRDYYVFKSRNNKILGIIGHGNNEIKTFFIDIDSRRMKVGTKLLSFIEKIIFINYKTIEVYSSASTKTFYENQGYNYIKKIFLK